ncbi:protein EXPORTIN 1B-like [Cannabis sativa]|uniref:Exportin-1 C-terminal domain-containing protein n=1 Tax=Cannabis sativa TaxID=3483 RepID=A0A7J6EIB3_CANSA|nr:protein EXPORTIN 1B-like [Cannabis sativa]XP_060974949.1 protein EXPORTIN 1B-like [Cannabis sativa]XP_060974951.1 protein EXPORTIN 1B-like [Cannabis sativa]KAF4358065.1 hypothetical protein G4B88_021814 [Cannabis sativa]
MEGATMEFYLEEESDDGKYSKDSEDDDEQYCYASVLVSKLQPRFYQRVVRFVNELFESRNDISKFKDHIRDVLVQSKEFSDQDNKDLYVEEAAAQREREQQRMLSIPGLITPNDPRRDVGLIISG